MTKYRPNQFLYLAETYLGNDMTWALKYQYDQYGSKWMADFWGYGPDCIVDSLKILGCNIYEKGRAREEIILNRKIAAHGGLEALLSKYGRSSVIARKLGVSHPSIGKRLRKAGWRYDRHLRVWKRNSVTTPSAKADGFCLKDKAVPQP